MFLLHLMFTMQMTTDSSKWMTTEMCTCFNSKIRTPLYSILQMLDLAPNGTLSLTSVPDTYANWLAYYLCLHVSVQCHQHSICTTMLYQGLIDS